MKKAKILLLLGVVLLSSCQKTPSTSSSLDDNSSSSGQMTYTVTWENYGGSVLEVDKDVKKGTIPTYNGETPLKTADKKFIYNFSHWSPEIEAVIKDVTYIAQ